ncbi:MAG: rhodanese-like domain-containing protein [Lachnospiraceae bacterium]|nr:rhodanese-like domain-containing protein [Lachnospiraceae bacterium]
MKKYMNLFLIVFVIFVLAGCSNNNTNNTENLESKKNSYTQISMEEAVKMMEEESDYIILDVRRPDEFAEKHIPNAINVPNETIGKDEIPELPNKEQLILVYCRSGNRSKQASEKLVKLGYTNIYEFGGINDWTGETVGEK